MAALAARAMGWAAHPRPAILGRAALAIVALALAPESASACAAAERAMRRLRLATPPVPLRAVQRADARAAVRGWSRVDGAPTHLLEGEWLAAAPEPAPEHAIHHPDVGEVRVEWVPGGDAWRAHLSVAGEPREVEDLPDDERLHGLLAALATYARAA
jgi:hypothetical protein